MTRSWEFPPCDEKGFFQMFCNYLLDDFDSYESNRCTLIFNCLSKWNGEDTDNEEEEVIIEITQLDRELGGSMIKELLGPSFTTRTCQITINYGDMSRIVNIENVLNH